MPSSPTSSASGRPALKETVYAVGDEAGKPLGIVDASSGVPVTTAATSSASQFSSRTCGPPGRRSRTSGSPQRPGCRLRNEKGSGRHPTPERAFEALSQGACMCAARATCSGPPLLVGLRDWDNSNDVLA